MITALLFSLALCGSPDSLKQTKVHKQAVEQKATIKRIDERQKDTIKLIEALKEKRRKEKENTSNDQVKLNK